MQVTTSGTYGGCEVNFNIDGTKYTAKVLKGIRGIGYSVTVSYDVNRNNWYIGFKGEKLDIVSISKHVLEQIWTPADVKEIT